MELPPEGGGSISMDDLQRDTRGALKPDWRAFVARRFREMHLEVADGTPLCGHRGDGPRRTLVAPEPGDVDGAVTVAVLISLAKAADTVASPGAWQFCVGEAPGTRLGPFGAGPIAADGTHAGTPDAYRRVERVDYRALAETTRTAWDRISAR